MWATAIGGIGSFFGSLLSSRRGPQYNAYQPEQNNTGTYLAIAAIIVILIVMILIIRAKK